MRCTMHIRVEIIAETRAIISPYHPCQTTNCFGKVRGRAVIAYSWLLAESTWPRTIRAYGTHDPSTIITFTIRRRAPR